MSILRGGEVQLNNHMTMLKIAVAIAIDPKNRYVAARCALNFVFVANKFQKNPKNPEYCKILEKKWGEEITFQNNSGRYGRYFYPYDRYFENIAQYGAIFLNIDSELVHTNISYWFGTILVRIGQYFKSFIWLQNINQSTNIGSQKIKKKKNRMYILLVY